MEIKLATFMGLLGYGSKVIIVDHTTDEEVFKSDNFTAPYGMSAEYSNAKVLCFGIYNGTLLVWVEK